ncbi:hypothetical protein L6164_007626 [Bauhinia variegata]|uniref:Uncharacterized protein n=1 Tax=Bauhinia variegata TaxID=167791 RepID=A0ACB9PGY9_BAUVA|nr:hypothetical protein L6164_007626 [Bauhinia variegata]
MAESSNPELPHPLIISENSEESHPDDSLYPIDHLGIENPFHSFGPFTPELSFDHRSNPSGWYTDSDTDSVSCFVTDLFESHSSQQSHPCCDDGSDINPFSGVVYDDDGEEGSNYSEELELESGFGFENDDGIGENSSSERVNSHRDGLRVVGFSSDSDSNSVDEFDRAMELYSGENDDNRNSDFDDSDVRLCWDRLCLGDQRILNENLEWEEVEERVNEREDLSVVIDDVDDRSIASGISNGEETGEDALRYLEWEILIAVNNLERNMDLENDDYIYAAEYDVLFGQFLENDSALKGSPPAAKSVVDSLPFVELTKEDLQGKNVACAICKDDILLEEKVRRLPCSHCYHGDCIMPWLGIRNTCPVCRFELPTDDPDYERRKSLRTAHDLLEFTEQMQF